MLKFYVKTCFMIEDNECIRKNGLTAVANQWSAEKNLVVRKNIIYIFYDLFVLHII